MGLPLEKLLVMEEKSDEKEDRAEDNNGGMYYVEKARFNIMHHRIYKRTGITSDND